MSDRASAAPPPSFLGPGEIAAYERQFYDADRPRPLRPVSSAGHYTHHERDHLPNPLAHSRSQQQQPPPTTTRKSGFWDGMRERFFLGRSKSSSVSDQPVAAAIANPLLAPPPPPGPAGGYPTRDQVLESYQTLVSSGFFESHAIHGTRHPPPPTMMMMGPPPPPRPVSTPHPMPVILPSPQRGTKRPTPADNDGAETGARKLVKKLRRSASRISVDLAVSFSKPNPPRPSTSSYNTGAASFISSAASSIYEHPEQPEQKTPAPKKKLTKPMPPMTAVTRGRRQGGWRERSRSRSRSRARPAMPNPNPNPLAMNPVDQQILHIPLVDDAMLVDQDTTPRPSTDTLSGRGTVLHPPPPSRGRATGRSPRKAAGPLSVVPDVNRGIPGVPRIPEGLMRAGGLSPAKEGGVFGFPRGKGGEGGEDVKMGGRDSGLGEEVEMEMEMGMDENRGVGVGVGW